MAANGNAEFSFAKHGSARNGLSKIQTQKNGICHDDSAPPVKAQTIDELHSLQRKKSAPTTPIKGTEGAFSPLSEEERQKQQLQSIRFLLSRTRLTHVATTNHPSHFKILRKRRLINIYFELINCLYVIGSGEPIKDGLICAGVSCYLICNMQYLFEQRFIGIIDKRNRTKIGERGSGEEIRNRQRPCGAPPLPCADNKR